MSLCIELSFSFSSTYLSRNIMNLNEEAADRLSLLSDDLIHHILSFLNIQSAIKTCLLSKRWKNLWASMPVLSFDFPSFSPNPYLFENLSFREPSKVTSFCHFILRVLSRRSPFSNLKKLSCSLLNDCSIIPLAKNIFHLVALMSEDDFTLEYLFNFASSYNVDELCINGRYLAFEKWRCCLSTCRSLKLTGCLDGTWEPMASQFLMSLEIENYRLDSYMKLDGDMFRSCPLLERLVLRGPCSVRAKISAPKLEYLEMGFGLKYHDYYCEDQFPEILLSTPKLASIKFENLLPFVTFSTDDFLSQHKFEFSLLLYSFLIISEDDDHEKKQQVGERLKGVLNLLQNANSLTLNLTAIEVLSQNVFSSQMEEEAFMFNKLKHLKLKANERSITMQNHMLSCLLSSPSLETLAIENDVP